MPKSKRPAFHLRLSYRMRGLALRFRCPMISRKLKFLRIAAATLVAVSLAGSPAIAAAQTYPDRPITLVVPFSAGGPTDILARILAASMSRTLGKTVVVEIRPGAGGTRAPEIVARAKADGYTFLIHHNGMSTAPALFRKLRYDPLSDFEYVGLTVDMPMTVVARKDFPPTSVRELFAYLEKNGPQVNLAHVGPGSVSHLCSMVLRKALGIELTPVAFQGTGPAMIALEGGHVDLLCDQTSQTLPHAKAGKIKLYATTTRRRLPTLPDTPTLAESGLKNFEVTVWHGIYAPKGTPPEATAKFGAALKAALKDPAVAPRIAELGGEVVPESKQTPAALRDWLKSEIEKWTPVIRASGSYLD
jgi:tripartite-type tricarboxylate transporter receptor subunit TctC